MNDASLTTSKANAMRLAAAKNPMIVDANSSDPNVPQNAEPTDLTARDMKSRMADTAAAERNRDKDYYKNLGNEWDKPFVKGDGA